MRSILLACAALVATGSAAAKTYEQHDGAVLRTLDKITGRSTDIEVEVNEPIQFGSLRVEMRVCYQTPPEEPPESAAFLQIEEAVQDQVDSMAVAIEAKPIDPAADDGFEPGDRLFSGWMFASTPGLSALEHPVYDVWVISCTASAPVAGAASE